VGNQHSTRSYFGKQVKAERERRGWSQSHMAKLLKDKGFSTYTTTIHKIETDQRPVPVDEAGAIADLFGVSLDRLLGRDLGPERDLAYSLQAIAQTAQQAAPLLSSFETALRERVAEMGTFDFAERAPIAAECKRAAAALRKANDALAALWPPLRDGLLAATTSRFIRDQVAEMGEHR
jgi:transcriptional regulator with XRE-family HTH domain